MAVVNVGDRFGRLVTVKKTHACKNGRKIIQWVVDCDCGNQKRVSQDSLRSGNTKSCGCLRNDYYKDIKKNKRNVKHGMYGTPEYRAWQSMLNRCNNINNKKYSNYGGRGIMVCEGWLDFLSFYNDVGNRPGDGYILGRHDIDGNYDKKNVYWTTQAQQQNKRRSGRILSAFGRTQSLIDWAKELDITAATLWARLKRGWDVERTLSTPNMGTGLKKMIGEKFGQLKVLQRAADSYEGKTQYYCSCSCGKKTIVRAVDLRLGNTKSCGCLRERNPKLWKGYKKISGIYWSNIKRNAAIRKLDFKITIEEAWDLFVSQDENCALSGVELYFVSDYTRQKLKQTASLDRIDSNKGYVIDNIQWVHKELNMIKNKFDQENLINWCKLIAKHNTEEKLEFSDPADEARFNRGVRDAEYCCANQKKTSEMFKEGWDFANQRETNEMYKKGWDCVKERMKGK